MTVANKKEDWVGNITYQIKDAAGNLLDNGRWVEERALNRRQ